MGVGGRLGLRRAGWRRVQLTTDRHRPYLWPVEDAFDADTDEAVLQKVYAADLGSDARYGWPCASAARPRRWTGDRYPKRNDQLR